MIQAPAVSGSGTGPKGPGDVLDEILRRGGLSPGVAKQVSRDTGVPEAAVYGAGSFYHLLDDPSIRVRVCQGLSCQLRGAKAVLEAAKAAGLPAQGCSCLAACDRPPAVLKDRDVLVEVLSEDIGRASGAVEALASAAEPERQWTGVIGAGEGERVFDLAGAPDFSGAARARAAELGAEATIEAIAQSGLQGRGGAGFPAAIKWRGVRGQAETTRYVVLNADEAEPGTFKDRELLMRRPDLVIEGLCIAADAVGAQEVYCYLRGEFGAPMRALEAALERYEAESGAPLPKFVLHAGHGAYICGEETALLESLEGKRGMPRLKPPFPTEKGLWGKPTLIHNVETIAAVPSIVKRGGEWFAGLGRTGAGSKLYCISGHVARPGIYEMPLGVCLDELVEVAGGYVGELKAFSPGGASSGFLPASERTRALDFKALAEVGSMLGSAGVVVLNDTVNMADAARNQLRFFEVESCGQCAPCRIGTRYQREAMDRRASEPARLKLAEDVAWEMREGSICGLGQTASLPLTSALRFFPEDFS